jgi:hypothetical protein
MVMQHRLTSFFKQIKPLGAFFVSGAKVRLSSKNLDSHQLQHRNYTRNYPHHRFKSRGMSSKPRSISSVTASQLSEKPPSS